MKPHTECSSERSIYPHALRTNENEKTLQVVDVYPPFKTRQHKKKRHEYHHHYTARTTRKSDRPPRGPTHIHHHISAMQQGLSRGAQARARARKSQAHPTRHMQTTSLSSLTFRSSSKIAMDIGPGHRAHKNGSIQNRFWDVCVTQKTKPSDEEIFCQLFGRFDSSGCGGGEGRGWTERWKADIYFPFPHSRSEQQNKSAIGSKKTSCLALPPLRLSLLLTAKRLV